MRFKIKHQQIHQYFGIAYRHGQLQHALVSIQAHVDLMRCAMTHAQSMADLIDEPGQDKSQRLEHHDGVIQFHRFFETKRFLVRIQGARGGSPRQGVQPDPILADPTAPVRNGRTSA